MMHQSKPIFISSFLIFVLLFSHSRSVTSQEVDDYEIEFDYREGSEKGPEHWGDLKPEWFKCKNGTRQSPIAISNVELIWKFGDLKRSYKPATAILRNRGYDIEVEWPNYSAGKIQVNGTDYFLEHVHWHSPSEHTIDGRRYDLELHMVHISLDPKVKNNISVVALLYKIGSPDPFLAKLTNSIKSIADQLDAERNLGIVDPNQIKMDGNKYYRYLGSLTTPPCSEVVIWTINEKIATVSKDQIKTLREAVLDYAEMNARPLQRINGRVILKLYDPHFTR